jgi:hypothetical protein
MDVGIGYPQLEDSGSVAEKLEAWIVKRFSALT